MRVQYHYIYIYVCVCVCVCVCLCALACLNNVIDVDVWVAYSSRSGCNYGMSRPSVFVSPCFMSEIMQRILLNFRI